MKLRYIHLIWSILGMLMSFNLISCRPANIPDVDVIKPNETAFMVPLEGDRTNQAKFDSEKMLEDNKVATGRVEINKRWRSTGRFWLSGEYVPVVQLIKVDREPVTVQFATPTDEHGTAIRNGNTKDDGIWIESADSVGLSLGFNVSAYIEAPNASKFLYLYAGRPLHDVIHSEVRGRILEVSQQFAASYTLDELRAKKGDMSLKIQEDVTKFFKERGITITNIGMFGGFAYENPEIQRAIDAVFIAQQEKNTTKAKMEAQASVNERVISEKNGLAKAAQEEADGRAKAILIEAEAKAKAIQLEADALAKAQQNPLYLEIQKLQVQKSMTERWSGIWPQTYLGSDSVSTILVPADLKTTPVPIPTTPNLPMPSAQ